MSAKTSFFYSTRVLFLSAILFLSYNTQAQKSENKTLTTEEPRTIDSVEKKSTTFQNPKNIKNQVAEAKTKTKKINEDKKKEQTPDSKENPPNKKTIELNHKLIANKTGNIQKTEDKTQTKEVKNNIQTKSKTENKNKEKNIQEPKNTKNIEKKTRTDKTNKVTKDKKINETETKNETEKQPETLKKNPSKPSKEKVETNTPPSNSATATKTKIDNQTNEKKNKIDKTKAKTDVAEKTKEKSANDQKLKNQTENLQNDKKEIQNKKTEKKQETDSKKNETKNTETKGKNPPADKTNETSEVKNKTEKTTQKKTETTPEKQDPQAVQKIKGSKEVKKESELKKEKTTLEYEAQQIKGNVIKIKEELKKQEAQAQKEKQNKKEETTVVVGHRGASSRSLFASPVPVDVIDSSKLITFGNTVNLTDQLNTLIPSYMASPATVKNTAFIRPTSLRGMAGDQTLVLVNGKRRHRSSLVQEFGPLTNRGSQGIDIAMIPTIALKNVEVLRGGASAQYGSDAMAGVLNFNLKEAPDKATVQATYGHFFEGERSWRVGANLGLSLLNNHGFANLSFDTNEAQGQSRGEQDLRASRLPTGIKHKKEIGIGNDAIFDDSPLVNSWGRPEKTSTRFMLNSGLQLNPNMKVYLFGNYAITNDRIRLFYRDPKDSAFMGNSRWADNLSEIKKTGFTPFLNGEQEDFSIIFGAKGRVLDSTTYDLSTGFGSNTLYQKIKNSLNPDSQLLYGAAQRDFNLGHYKHQEQSFNADFSTILNEKTNTNVSYGLEYREELFGQYAGSFGSYVGRGPSGMMGTSLLEAGEYKRNNYSAYVDIEHTFRKSMFIQYSLRYDHFSDFGQTTNNKIASLINLTPNFSLRGSFSTNFRAPTLGQSNLMSTITDELPQSYHHNIQSRTINIPAGPNIRAFGGSSLEEEKSTDASLGFISKVSDNSHISLDGYTVNVKDRIYKNVISHNAYENNISFFANALDLKHQGVDLVWTTDLSRNISFADILFLNLAYNYNTIDITDNKFISGRRVLDPEQVEDMENNYPKHNFILTANAQIQKWGLMTRARYIGDHYGEMGTLERRHKKEKDYNDSKLSRQIDSVVYVDLELSYKPTKDFTFAVGGANIFDKYPQRMTRPYANLMNYGMPYDRQTVANYEGGSWYLRMLYNF